MDFESIKNTLDKVKENATKAAQSISEEVSDITSNIISSDDDNIETAHNEQKTSLFETKSETNDVEISNSNQKSEINDENKDGIISNLLSGYESLKEKIRNKISNVIHSSDTTHFILTNKLVPDFILGMGAGRLYDLSQITNLETKFDNINLYHNGRRIDKSLGNWKIKAGNSEVEILTDNNIVSEEWSKKSGNIPKNGTVLTDDMKNAINEALQTLHKSGQDVPNKVYLTNMFNDRDQAKSGYFSSNYPNAIFLQIDDVQDPEFLKHVIYHETAHMIDYYNNGDRILGHFLSEEAHVNISPCNFETIEPKFTFGDKQIKASDINSIICGGSNKNPQELKQEIEEMINNGIIVQSENGKYSLDMDKYLAMPTANVFLPGNSGREQQFNNLMNLYNYLQENDVDNFEFKNESNVNIIEFNGKKIDKIDINKIIGCYSLTNNKEFVAEVSAMLTAGTIVQDKDGHYKLNTDEKGEYKNAIQITNRATEEDNEKLNDIMELYNYMTDGKIAKAKVVE